MDDKYFKKTHLEIDIASIDKKIKLLELQKEQLKKELEQVETTEQQLDLLGGEG